jgi:predicted Rossmann-fold nucleotide-binding protein
MGSAYWNGFKQFLRDQLLANEVISEADVDILRVTDDPDEAVAMIQAAWEGK